MKEAIYGARRLDGQARVEPHGSVQVLLALIQRLKPLDRDVILSQAEIFAEAGEIFAGTKRAPAGTSVFKSVGIAAEDIAAARLVHAAAAREG